MVGKVRKTRPDGSDAIVEEVSSLDTEQCRPHGSHESTKHDDWVAAVHAKDGTDQHGERDMICGTNLSGQCQSARAQEEAAERDGDRLTGCEAQAHDGGDCGCQRWCCSARGQRQPDPWSSELRKGHLPSRSLHQYAQ